MPSNPETWADEELVRDWIRESTLVSQDLWAAYAEWEHLMELLNRMISLNLNLTGNTVFLHFPVKSRTGYTQAFGSGGYVSAMPLQQFDNG